MEVRPGQVPVPIEEMAAAVVVGKQLKKGEDLKKLFKDLKKGA